MRPASMDMIVTPDRLDPGPTIVRHANYGDLDGAWKVPSFVILSVLLTARPATIGLR